MEPTPIEQGVTRYRLSSLDVDLQNGRKERPVRAPYVTEAVLADQFRDDITSALAERGIRAREDTRNAMALDIAIDYERRFVWSSASSLIKPHVSHEVKIRRGDELLASTASGTYTTSYNLIKDVFRDWAIIFLMSGPEHEREDVATISEALVEDIAALGRKP